MEQKSASQQDRSKRGIPLWLFLVLCFVIILLILVIAFFVLLHLDVIRCVQKEAGPAEQKNL